MILDLHDPTLDEYRDEAAKFSDAFAKTMATRPRPDFSTPEGLAAARDISSFQFGTGDATGLGVTPEDRVVSAGGAEVPVRIFRPAGDARASTSTSAAAATSAARAWATSGTPAVPKPCTWQW